MKTRYQRALRITGVLAIVLAVTYLAAPALIEMAVKHALRDAMRVTEFDIAALGWRETRIASLHVENERMGFRARQATLRHALWPPRLHGIEIEQAVLSLDSGSSTDDAPAPIPAVPGFPLRVDDLRLEMASPWGPVAVPMSMRSGPGPVGRFIAEVQSPQFTLVVSSVGNNRHELVVSDDRDTVLLSMSGITDKGFPLELEGNLNPEASARWLQREDFVPEAVKAAADHYRIEGTSLRFTGLLRQNMDFETTLRGTVKVRDHGGRIFESLEIDTQAGYTITRSGPRWSGSGPAALTGKLDPETVIRAADPSWFVDEGELWASAQAPRFEQPGIQARSIEITTPDLTRANASGQISLRGARMDGWPPELARYDIDGEWSRRSTGIRAAGTANGEALPRLSWSLEMGDGRGKAEVRLHHALASLAPSLRPYTQVVARELAINNGKIGGVYRFEWDPDRQQTTLDVSVGPADLDLDEMEIRGLAARVTHQGDDLSEIGISVLAPTIKLAAGAVAERFEATLRLAYPRLHIEQLQTRLFGGRFTIRPTTIDLSADQWILFLDISNLSLEAIMALLELEATRLTGTIAGPARLVLSREGGIAIDKAELRSVQPGVLKFPMSADSEPASQLDNIALRALEELKYEELSASVLYGHDGSYRIKARMVGQNPKVLDGHPIALNPDIEGRLPALFRAFFLTGDFNRAILENIREQE